MKKIILSLLIVLVLSWSCEMVFAKGKGGGKSGGGQKADTNKPADKSEQVRKRKSEKDRERKQEQWNEQKKERVREMKRKGKEKSRADKDVGELADRTKKGKAKGKSVEKDVGKGKGHQQQMNALGKQMLHEDAKHRKRLVRLRRIRELAVKEGATKVVERVDKLLGKERQRYERKLQRMVGRKEKPLQLGEKTPGKEAQKAVKQAGDKGKGKAEAKERREIKGKEKDTEKKAEE